MGQCASVLGQKFDDFFKSFLGTNFRPKLKLLSMLIWAIGLRVEKMEIMIGTLNVAKMKRKCADVRTLREFNEPKE